MFDHPLTCFCVIRVHYILAQIFVLSHVWGIMLPESQIAETCSDDSMRSVHSGNIGTCVFSIMHISGCVNDIQLAFYMLHLGFISHYRCFGGVLDALIAVLGRASCSLTLWFNIECYSLFNDYNVAILLFDINFQVFLLQICTNVRVIWSFCNFRRAQMASRLQHRMAHRTQSASNNSSRLHWHTCMLSRYSTLLICYFFIINYNDME